LTGWWTYEFCRGAHVKQFHQEDKVVKAQFYLGKKLSGVANDDSDNVGENEEDDDEDDDEEEVDIGLDTISESDNPVDPETGYPKNYVRFVVESKEREKLGEEVGEGGEGEGEGEREGAENEKQDHKLPQTTPTKKKSTFCTVFADIMHGVLILFQLQQRKKMVSRNSTPSYIPKERFVI